MKTDESCSTCNHKEKSRSNYPCRSCVYNEFAPDATLHCWEPRKDTIKMKDFTLTGISKVPMNGSANFLFYWFAFTDPVTGDKERITFCDTTDNIDFNNRTGLRAWKY